MTVCMLESHSTDFFDQLSSVYFVHCVVCSFCYLFSYVHFLLPLPLFLPSHSVHLSTRAHPQPNHPMPAAANHTHPMRTGHTRRSLAPRNTITRDLARTHPPHTRRDVARPMDPTPAMIRTATNDWENRLFSLSTPPKCTPPSTSCPLPSIPLTREP